MNECIALSKDDGYGGINCVLEALETCTEMVRICILRLLCPSTHGPGLIGNGAVLDGTRVCVCVCLHIIDVMDKLEACRDVAGTWFWLEVGFFNIFAVCWSRPHNDGRD